MSVFFRLHSFYSIGVWMTSGYLFSKQWAAMMEWMVLDLSSYSKWPLKIHEMIFFRQCIYQAAQSLIPAHIMANKLSEPCYPTGFWLALSFKTMKSKYGGLAELRRHMTELSKVTWHIIRASEVCLEFLLSFWLTTKVYMFESTIQG